MDWSAEQVKVSERNLAMTESYLLHMKWYEVAVLDQS